MHPQNVVYLEHDGKLLLVDQNGTGPQDCIMGRQETDVSLRFPTPDEVEQYGIEWVEERHTDIRFDGEIYTVIHGSPQIDWPEPGLGRIRSSLITQFTPLPVKQFIAQFIASSQRSLFEINRIKFSWSKSSVDFSKDIGVYLEDT